MSRRLVLKTHTNADGVITALCNETEFWSPVRSREAIKEIETGMHTYFVIENDVRKNIVVTNDFNIKQLNINWGEELNSIPIANKQGKA